MFFVAGTVLMSGIVMSKTEYTNISLPDSLMDDVRLIVEDDLYGYSSISEFVKDAVRRRLEEIT